MSRDLLRELRRYAGLDDRKRAEEILRDMLAQAPDDCFAMLELKRLEEGKPLLSASDFKTYRNALHQSALRSLQELMLHYPAAGMGRMVTRKLRRILAGIKLQEARLSDRRDVSGEMTEYKKALRHELGKRSILAGGRWAFPIGILLALSLMLGVAGWHMRHQAEATDAALEKALEAEDWQRVMTLKDSANSGINKLLYPAIVATVYRADAWIAHKKALHREVVKAIHALQSGERSIESMPLSQRAVVERYLRALPQELRESERVASEWECFCEQSKQQWMREIPEVLEQLRAPLPPLPEWTGAEEDALSIRRYIRELQGLLKTHNDSVDAYRLDVSLLKPLEEKIEHAKKLRKGIDEWLKTLHDMNAAKDYRSYLKILRGMDASTAYYPPAGFLIDFAKYLPSLEEVHHRMRDPEGETSPEMLEAMRHVLLERGASFCRESPACAQQVELLEDLFTTRTLRTKLYRIISPQGEVAYSAAPYVREDTNNIRFRRAELDPAFRLDKSPDELWRAAGVRQHRLDATGLVSVAGLSRNAFFTGANLPMVLGAVLNYEHGECPALAKAYVYDTLLRVMQMHQQPALIGAAYSPSLSADVRSFIRMRRTLGIHLTADCWLQPTQRAADAEAVVQAWFRERRGRDYAAEIERNYGAVAAVYPRYVGYVNAGRTLVACGNYEKGDELWYVGAHGLTCDSREAVVCAQSAPFSPVFVKVREKEKKH